MNDKTEVVHPEKINQDKCNTIQVRGGEKVKEQGAAPPDALSSHDSNVMSVIQKHIMTVKHCR